MRRSPLPKRTKPIRSRSRKREEYYRTVRRPLVAQLLADQPICQRCHTTYATDVHEIQSRARGGSLDDLDNLALLCRPCHTWVTDNPAEATREGWSRPSSR